MILTLLRYTVYKVFWYECQTKKFLNYDNREILPKAPGVFRLVLTHALTDRNSRDECTLLIPEEVYPTETENKN